MRHISRSSGFTLVELMVSVAIALVLVLGINVIFRISSQTVGAGQSTLSCERDARTIMQTLLMDTQSIAPVAIGHAVVSPSSPCLVIRSEHDCAFRSASEQQSATDQVNPSHDTFLFPTAIYPNNTAPVPLIHWRSHRLDRLAFFSHGNTPARQTSSNSNSFVATDPNTGRVETGVDAWVFYGHAAQPNNTVIKGKNNTDWWGPGDGTSTTNDHGYYANDWFLARMALILNPNPPATDLNYLVDAGGLTPLSTTYPLESESTSVSGGYAISSGRFDLAQISMAGPLRNWGDSNRTNGIWSYGVPVASGGNLGMDWWSPLTNYRLQASPYMLPDTKSGTAQKISPYGLAKCAPDLVRGCSQFIVEYAGSYYTKNPDGTAAVILPDGKTPPTPQLVPTPDGQIDFVVDPVTGVRQIRWYGFPRSVVYAADNKLHPEHGDVLPLRDILGSLTPSGITPSWGTMDTTGVPPRPNVAKYADAERFSSSSTGGTDFPQAGTGAGPQVPPNYMDTSVMRPENDQNNSSDPSTLPTKRYYYSAAFGPDVVNQPFPKMIRIIVAVDDHEGRLNQPLLFEYVYDISQ